ncbi:hypothetical protein CLAFUW4_14454 [Fulvia fulva]|uniref:Uncharacterized protein n=1 Tax=Passalora fulva TaxID=5499 RepID=A0A9Q8PLW3_PASFU|nr:uncharacterized protein CLAFUR5_14286 [Fulvia fulva]KAK4609312.1 hypothetical protein CLAFUR4_14449 [Fulvia fulva]KAK4609867.1 hypothetical protein CLAFUR0_14451 [Fulvia fulva]UJO24841.1 hypothetical protein CLAFUR5_14286 [Fulvia fulva]WPV22597.1 hypothetical protein CLAFUW4_14454 [Fulvia fulva]WPV37397.1 hypothetical protein CLAFUW7_14458 [Fulvia fulva]
MATAAHDYLTTLPQEIFDQIVENVRGTSDSSSPSETAKLYATLRLINRRACAKADKAFAKHHFSTAYTLLCDDESHIRTEWIASHPRWGKAIETLIFNVDEVERTDNVMVSTTQHSRSHVNTATGMLRGYQLHQNQQYLRNSRQDLLLLNSIFSHVRRNGNKVEIQVRDHLCNEDHIRQSRRAWTKYADLDSNWISSRSVFLTPEPDHQRPLRLLLNALSLSQLDVQHFSLETAAWSISTDSFAHPALLSNFRESLGRTVTNMKLALWTPVPAARGSVTAFVRELANCQHLSSLWLSFYHQDIENLEAARYYKKDRFIACDIEPDNGQQPGGHLVVQELFKHKFAKLETLRLDHAAFYVQDLQSFVAQNGQLRTFNMMYGKMGGCEEWCLAKSSAEASRFLTGFVGIDVGCFLDGEHHMQNWSKKFWEWKCW